MSLISRTYLANQTSGMYRHLLIRRFASSVWMRFLVRKNGFKRHWNKYKEAKWGLALEYGLNCLKGIDFNVVCRLRYLSKDTEAQLTFEGIEWAFVLLSFIWEYPCNRYRVEVFLFVRANGISMWKPALTWTSARLHKYCTQIVDVSSTKLRLPGVNSPGYFLHHYKYCTYMQLHHAQRLKANSNWKLRSHFNRSTKAPKQPISSPQLYRHRMSKYILQKCAPK